MIAGLSIRRRRLKPSPLPHPLDAPRAAFLGGWYSGLAVGSVLSIALGVIALLGVR